jgi:enoyl-CoA hydratase/carnithine racemase
VGYQNLTVEQDGHCTVVTLNRPQRRNALSLELMLELIECLDGLGRDRVTRAVILAAAGKVFCSGHDLSEMTGRDINEYRRLFDVCTELMTKIQTIPQPVIAEVQGVATAAGCQLGAHRAVLHHADGGAQPRGGAQAGAADAADG